MSLSCVVNRARGWTGPGEPKLCGQDHGSKIGVHRGDGGDGEEDFFSLGRAPIPRFS